jgi:glycosyltransferase involved in cell wall biosynthesis
LVPQKDHATLLRALARMHRQSRLLILGTGEQQSKLATLSHDLGIADRVCFAGFVTNPLPYIRSATAFILCSAYEGFGNAIVEALGCGTPVISTDCPYGPSEILANGRYGTLVPVGGVQALADAMETAGPISSAKRRDLRNRAAAFTADRAAQSYHKLLVSPSCMASQSASFS